MKRKVLTLLGTALAGLCLVAAPASARWAYGAGGSDIDLNVQVSPGAPDTVCATHIDGRAGLSTDLDAPIPPGPYPALTVQLFAGPPAVIDGAHRLGSQIVAADGTPLTPVAVDTTPPATALDPTEPYGPDLKVYAAAPFSFTPSPASVHPGDDIIVYQPGRPAFVSAGVVDCSAPIAARIDVLPGIASNPVVPWVRLPALPVRVFGSATLDVTKIDTVKLGDAAPATIPPALAPYFAPRDRDGDGYLDRDYLFVPAQTGIACGDTSVTLAGTLTGGTTFSGADAIRTVGCR